MIVSTPNRYIHFVSKGWVGKTHDYTQLKHEFCPDQPWFRGLSVSLDLGYQGFVKEYECQVVNQPQKKPKNGELSPAAKAENKRISSGRIWVEHAIGGLKRYRYLSDRLRTHKVKLYESTVLVCAGLWNFYLTN